MTAVEEKAYKYDFGQLLRQYAELTKTRRRGLILASVLITCMQTLAIVESVLFGKIVQAGLHRSALTVPLLTRFSKILLVIFGVQILLTLAKSIAMRRTVIGTVDELYDRCLTKITRLNGPFIELNNPTNLFGRCVKGIGSVESISWQIGNELLPLGLTFVGTIIAVFIVAPHAALVLLPTIFAFTALTIWARNRFVQMRKQRHRIYRDAHGVFGEIVHNLRTIIANNQQERLLKRHYEMMRRATSMLYREYDFYDYMDAGRSLLISLARLGVFVVVILVGLRDPELGGRIVILSLLSERLLRSCYSIGNAYDRFIDACEPINEMTEVLNEPEPITDPVEPKQLEQVYGEIAFENVSFAYPSNSNKLALDVVNFTIKAGEKVGIVGESGGGKSTLIKLILRFIDPLSGSVRLDGVDLRHLRQFDARRAVGYVSQHVDIFDDTILENIRFGRPEASEEEVIRVAKLAHAHEFITSFSEGYATRVGDRGLRLSGGQIQRIGLARALLRDPQIILLDEATASVDVHNDAGIHRSIREIAKTGKTVIIIAHRLSTVKDADRIICLDKGKIVETGTPAELRRHPKGYFSALLATQEALDRVEETTLN